MNLSRRTTAPTRLLHSLGLMSRRLLPRQQSHTFGSSTGSERHRIERIYAINLDSQPDRWAELCRELNQVLDSSRSSLAKRTVRFPAVDARSFAQPPLEEEDVDPFYGDVPCAVETERRLGSRLRNHFRRLAEPELRVARSERRHQLRHVLAAVHAPKALGGFQHPGRDPA